MSESSSEKTLHKEQEHEYDILIGEESSDEIEEQKEYVTRVATRDDVDSSQLRRLRRRVVFEKIEYSLETKDSRSFDVTRNIYVETPNIRFRNRSTGRIVRTLILVPVLSGQGRRGGGGAVYRLVDGTTFQSSGGGTQRADDEQLECVQVSCPETFKPNVTCWKCIERIKSPSSSSQGTDDGITLLAAVQTIIELAQVGVDERLIPQTSEVGFVRTPDDRDERVRRRRRSPRERRRRSPRSDAPTDDQEEEEDGDKEQRPTITLPGFPPIVFQSNTNPLKVEIVE